MEKKHLTLQDRQNIEQMRCKLDHQVRAHRSHHGAQAPVALALIDQAKRDRWFESNCHHRKSLSRKGLGIFFVSFLYQIKLSAIITVISKLVK